MAVFLNKRMKLVYFTKDNLGMERIEALCGRCDSHLGHLLMMALRQLAKDTV
jgi:peptide methionine sulfoxide reductase MsrB